MKLYIIILKSMRYNKIVFSNNVYPYLTTKKSAMNLYKRIVFRNNVYPYLTTKKSAMNLLSHLKDTLIYSMFIIDKKKYLPVLVQLNPGYQWNFLGRGCAQCCLH